MKLEQDALVEDLEVTFNSLVVYERFKCNEVKLLVIFAKN